MTTACLPSCFLGALPWCRMLLSLYPRREARLTELKPLCKSMKQGTGHRSLGFIAKPSKAWHSRAQSGACFGVLGCTCKPSRTGRANTAHTAVLWHRRTQQPSQEWHKYKEKLVASDSSWKLSGCQTTNKLETFPSLILLDMKPEPSSFFSSSSKDLPWDCLYIWFLVARIVLALTRWKAYDL